MRYCQAIKLIFLLLILFGCSEKNHNSEKLATYVGAQKCASCHQAQVTLWQGSHHDLAMQDVNEKSVLGDFNNATFNYFGTVTRFYKKDRQFFVKTDGPDGKLTEYPIAYTFGVFPLQQYLIKFPKGRYQALNIAWDARTKKEGGQRWFHLYPNEHIKHNDELHWTGINHNWNFMCADCHSLNLQKNYNLVKKEYKTTWSDIDVSCEACHGPGSRHIDWAENKNEKKNKGFSVDFNERKNITWTIDPVTGNARRSHKKETHTEIEACAQCHARRTTTNPDARPEHALLDNYRIALLSESLYHADGQINGEVYVYGSFVQSKMYHAGVTCSDCHQPHSLKLRMEGNKLCSQCHLTSKYDSANHHMHKPASAGAKCINCHMPTKKYMVVDPRRDHSFRIPRPDLSVKLGVPNACSQCHKNKPTKWAAAKLAEKFGQPDKGHYGEALFAGRQRLPGAGQLLSDLITDDTQPAIARATALTLIPPYLSKQTAPVLQFAANDEEPLLGFGLASALGAIPVPRRPPFAYPLLYDDMRNTRMLAARALTGISLANLPAEASSKYNNAIEEYKTAQEFNADRPESLVNLAGLYAQQGKIEQAELYYQDAINMAPYFTPAHTNLADLYRGLGNDIQAEAILRKALLQVRDKTTIQHTLGLTLVRQKRLAEAIKFLRLAAKSPAATDRYVYVYAIALNSTGKAKQALAILEQAQHQYPVNTDIVYALMSINKEQGNQEKEKYYENKLRALRK